MRLHERYKGVIEWFSENMKIAESELRYENPYQLLVSVILSAQCTDKRVNMTTPALFDKYPVPELMAAAEPEEVYEYIKSISYPNNKARNLVGMARKLVSDFNSVVPDDVNELQKLPGVGRKTANVVAAVIYNKYVMPVDTHVFRVSERIGLTRGAKTPLQTELQLTRHIPAHLLPTAHHWLILHGRYVCMARRPHCGQCGITQWCRYWEKLNKDKGQEAAGTK
ncbi:MAG: endonuclease III [Alistipes sp.]|nr:endonuclease III [Alistipes sp.]